MSRRTEKISAAVRRALQEVLARGLSDPRVRGLITITGVRVTEDLTVAKVSVSVLPADQQELTLHGLRAAAGFLRKQIRPAIPMRRTPLIEFRLDESIKREAAVLGALEAVRREREAAGHPAEEAEPAS
ncbi:MAG: 30S ribosome-binding factor RbfA [Phycisphaerales bacterium]|nr:30S ribosome-binding factor RbfA [Phycisphaerales bacterium]